jgi:hypothetical protein
MHHRDISSLTDPTVQISRSGFLKPDSPVTSRHGESEVAATDEQTEAAKTERSKMTPPRCVPEGAVGPLFHDERSHHVVLFMLQDVAVPNVLSSASSRTHRIAHRRCRQVRQVELHDDSCGLTRVYAHRVLPPDFIRIWRHGLTGIALISRVAGEGLPLNELHVHEVKVDGMRVGGEVHDLPHFRRTSLWVFR